jgi:uncharacterized membrane protein YhaH (DUF805 family)
MLTDQSSNQRSGAAAFLFPTKVGRLSYFLRLLTVLAMHLGVYLFSQQLADAKTRALIVISWVILALIYGLLFIVLPRVRDFGLPTLAAVLFLIPILNTVFALCLLFGPQNYWQVIQSKISKT